MKRSLPRQMLLSLAALSLISSGAISARAQSSDLDALGGAPQSMRHDGHTITRRCTTVREGPSTMRVCRVERRGSTPSWFPSRGSLRTEIPPDLRAADLPGDDEVGTPRRPRRDDPPAITLPRRQGPPAVVAPRRDGPPAIILPKRPERLTPRLRHLPAPWTPRRTTVPPIARTPVSPARTPVSPARTPVAPARVRRTPQTRQLAAVVTLTPREAHAYDLLNAARRRQGLHALRVDPRAVGVARAHSQDMCARHYFDHRSPDGQAPWDRLRARDVRFSAAAENIAMGYTTATKVHEGWMKSPGHRSNRMNPSYTRVGIGVYTCGATPYWTEVFMK